MKAPSMRPWRPLGEADERVARERVDAALAEFSSRWFAKLRLSVGRARVISPGTVPQRTGWLAAGALAVHAAPRVFFDLACEALDLSPPQLAAGTGRGGSGLVDTFAQRLRDDLCASLRATVELPALAHDGAPSWSDGIVCLTVECSHEKRAGFELWCALEALMAWRPLISPMPTPVSLASREAALADTAVRLEAVVGQVCLPLAHLVELECGDVLVLDQALHEPCRLRDPGTSRDLARGRLCRSEGRVGVELHSL